MKRISARKHFFLSAPVEIVEIAALVAIVALVAFVAGCSGVPNGSGSGGGGGGGGSTTATLAVTMTSKPALSLTNIAVLSATVGVTGITLTPLTGTAVPLTLSPTVYPVDLTRLQSDSAFLGSLTLATGDYTGATVTFSAPVLTIFNNSGATVNSTCLTGTICTIVLTAGSATVTAAPFPLTLTSGQSTGVSLNLDLNTALTLTTGNLAVDFTTVNALTAEALPRTGTPSGALDVIEDFVGVVTAVSSSSLTVQSTNGIVATYTLPATPTIEDPQGLCPALNTTCLVANQSIVSVDATVSTTGTLTATSVDLLETSPMNEAEGTVVLSGTPGQFYLVVTNTVASATSPITLLGSSNLGQVFRVTLSNPLFIVDTDEFFNNASLPSSDLTTLFSSEADLVNGQDVMVHVTAASGAASAGTLALTADQVRLRFSRVTGTVASISGDAISLSNLPSYIGFATNPLAQTIAGTTNFDGVTDVNSLTAGQTVSIRALLLNNSTFSFYAAKVRVQP
jgi:hypothetical protein